MNDSGKDWRTAADLVFPPFKLCSDVDVLYCGEKVVPLEPNAVRVLRFLAENRWRVVSKQELLDTVWRDVYTTEDVLKKAVSQIRRALGDDLRNPKYVETHHRRGYRFIREIIPIFDAAGKSDLPTVKNADSAEKTAHQTDADFNRFVGRETEIELLRSEYRRTLSGGGQPILIIGEPGIGKTQLSAHFERWATGEQQAVVLRTRFYDYEAARISARDLFLDLIKESLLRLERQTGNSIDKTVDLHRAAAKFNIELPAEIFRPADKSQLQPTDAYQIIAPLAECFIQISRVAPLVLIFDDLQWADDLSRQTIGYLMRAGASEKLLILALARRAECENPAHEFAVWLNAQAVFRSFSVVALRPLTETDFGELLEQAFGAKLDITTIPYRESNLIYRTTGGNPYFFIETLRMLIAERVIEKTFGERLESVWTWRGLSDVPLPETVRMAARGKLIRLTAEAKDYVEHAAVLGDAFAVETLHEMFGGEKSLNENALENSLREAVSVQVLTEQNVSGADDCQFYHTTLRRAVYADLSPRRRRRLHWRAAKAIENIYNGETERIANSLSVHYEAAGARRECFEHALSAAGVAGKRFDWREAAECAARANRAAEALEKNDATRLSPADHLRLLLSNGEAIMSTGRREEAEKTLEKAAALAAALGDEISLAAARSVQGHARVLLGRYREALDSSTEALELSKKLNDETVIADALLQIGSAQYALGEFNRAGETLRKIIDNPDSGNYQKAVALGKIGWVLALQGRYREAETMLEQALTFHRTTGDVRQRVVLFLCLNWCEHGLGEYESAIYYAAEAGREARQSLGESFSEAVAQVRIGKTRLAQGQRHEAETILNSARAKSKNIGSVHCEAEAIWLLGRAKIAAGETAAAAELLDQALASIREIGDREDEFRILIDIAELEILQNNFAEALNAAEIAAAIARELEIADGIGAALVAQAGALLKLKKHSEAREIIETAIELLEAAESGERWRAFYLRAEILEADLEKNRNAPVSRHKKPEPFSDISSVETVETVLRRAVELLSEIHAQFGAADRIRSNLFRHAHQKPARQLRRILENSNRPAEAAELARFWQLD